jgi:hypothetical protein
MDLIVHLLTFLYSVAIIPFNIATIVLSSYATSDIKSWGASIKDIAGLLLLAQGAMSAIMIIIPYLSSVTLERMYLEMNFESIIWYHTVWIPTSLCAPLAAASFFLRTDVLFTIAKTLSV